MCVICNFYSVSWQIFNSSHKMLVFTVVIKYDNSNHGIKKFHPCSQRVKKLHDGKS